MKRICLLLPRLILMLTPAFVAAAEKDVDDSITVRVVGTLRSGIVAIGGETTGTTITAGGITWELAFAADSPIHRRLETLNGKQVVVQGKLERRDGVEIQSRWIVSVSDLEVAGDNKVINHGSKLHAAVGRADSRVQVVIDAQEAILDVYSRFGIDTATITRASERWPESMLVRLHLGGLELLNVDNGMVSVEWSVASTKGNAKRVALRADGTESTLDKQSPFYTEVRMVGGNGEIPLKGGYFEVRLPAKLLARNPRQIRLRWIDFYRN